MDLEVLGRHALLFDDDAMAAFVNSTDALVDWNSLKIDRYDVRHLLSAPLPPRRRRNPQTSFQLPDFAFESEIDQERYLDLPPPSDGPEGEEALKPEDNGGYRAVAFSYGNSDESADQKNPEGGLECSGFRPPFAVPESLLHSLPPTEKVHQIIAKTATFVSKHGGQSEIVLRVKQGDNPTFGFLMPDHHLHPYFRFLVDHQELLQSAIDGKTQPEDQMAKNQISAVGGALSLLGSVYGSGEDEDSAIEGGHDVVNLASEKTFNTSSIRDSKSLQKTEFSLNEAEKDKEDIKAKHPLTSNKEKTPVLKKNPSIASSKAGTMSSLKQKDDSGSFSSSVEKLKEPLMLEPPSDIKRLIEKIVEFIIKNGRQFETTLREQDIKHGRFPFLLPSNQYHPYYLKVLQRAEESKVGSRHSFHGRDDVIGCNLEKRAPLSKDNDASSLGYFGSDIPFESDRKEKFKMVIGKSKKDMLEAPSKATQQELGISVDAAAAAAILQAATRGIRNPNLGIISGISVNGGNHGHNNEVGQVSNLGSQGSSQLNEIIQISDRDGGCSSSDPAAQTTKGAVAETAAEADSSGAHLTREQKLKAERLKRAKMFVAQLKSGSGPSLAEPSRALSAEPAESGSLGAATQANLVNQAKEGSSVPVDRCTRDESENTGRKHFGDEYGERRLRRKYRSRSERHDMDDENDDKEETEENHLRRKHRSHGSLQEGNGGREKDEEVRSHKHSKRRHRSHHLSCEEENGDENRKEKSRKRSRKKHRSRHSSHEDDDGQRDIETSYHKNSSRRRSSHRSSSDEMDDRGGAHEDEKYHKHSRKKHRSHRDSRKHRKESRRRSKHESSSDTEHGTRARYVEHLQKEDLEEGEISSKVSDKSRGSVANGGSCETSMDTVSTRARTPSQPSETTEVSDDLRAKIRAMLMATR